VPKGVDSLRKWADYRKLVWCWIEAADIGCRGRRPTLAQMRAEVWMALVHGADGFGYFCHEFKRGDSCRTTRAPVTDTLIGQAVKAINQEVLALAPVLNRPTIANGAAVASSNAAVPVDIMVKKLDQATYLFATAMRDSATTAVFTVPDMPKKAKAEVLFENRTLPLKNGVFEDTFAGYGVHLYKIK
jgi:hypothetical protein